MTTNNGCNHAPLSPGGQEVKALYFTKAPGDKYLSVYAQYNGDPTWVPLHLTVPATPDLQQVRDMDRNIAIDSGSYEDAHIYLRSADGNNMTAAYFTNGQGGGIQVGNAVDYAALNLQPDGGSLTYGGAEVATQNWVKEFALTRKSDAVTNFNTVTQQGIYSVVLNLKSIPNYPNIGNNNNDATSGYLVVYAGNGNVVQYFYPTNEAGTMSRSAGYWYRSAVGNTWEYRNGVLEIWLNGNPVNANTLELTGDYLVTGTQANMVANNYPDPGAAIPLMLSVKKRWGGVSFNYAATQEIVAVRESGSNFTRKWIRSCFNWNGGKVWDAWNEMGLLRDVYTKGQLNASGAGGSVHWDNVSNKPTIVNTETDPTVPSHVKAITTTDISNWNAKENTANKSTAATLGNSNTLFPTQNAVKVYVDTAITNNNASYIPVAQKGAANGVATLDSSGKIPDAQIPAIAITNTSSVTSQAAMLALTAEVGDVAVRTDLSKTFILQNAPATTLANWIELKSPTITNSDQVPEGATNLYFTNTRARNAVSALAPVTYNATTGAIGIAQANGSTNGYLSSTDWNTFNNKLSSFTETDPVYTANDPKLVKSRQNWYGNGNSLTLNNATTEHGFAYADGSVGAGFNGPFISAGQLNGTNNYLLQIIGAYDGTGKLFKVRTKNGDSNTWNPWRKIYTDADTVLTAVPALQAVATAGNAYTGDLLLGTAVAGNEVFVGAGNGTQNTRLGQQTLASVTTGDARWNTAIGSNALKSMISGYNNTAVGEWAMPDWVSDSSTMFSNNTSIGDASMQGAASGVGNTALGANAGGVLGTPRSRGNRNLMIGHSAGALGAGLMAGNYNIFIGDKAGTDIAGSNQLRIGNRNDTTGEHIIEGDMSLGTLKLNSALAVKTMDPYTTGGCSYVVWNNTSKKYETITPEFLTTETDPVWTAAIPRTLTFKAELSTTNLNTILTTGLYQQSNNSETLLSRNYPIQNRLGVLQVYGNAVNAVTQEYTIALDAAGTSGEFRKWARSYWAGVWSPWKEITTYDQINLQNARNNNANVWGTGSDYSNAPIQLRESDAAGSGASYGPRIAFHWGGVVASQLALQASGRIAVVNNPGTGYENLVVEQVYSNSGFRMEADNSRLTGGSGYWGLYTAGNGTHPLKTGGLTISDSYSDSAPAYGLSVKGNTWLKGDKTIIGKNIQNNEEIAAVLGYSDFSGDYEKVKFIAKRLDNAARQNLYICVNTAYNAESAATADSKIFVDGTTGNVGIGTTSASAQLTVAGNTNISGSIQSNSLAGSVTNMVVADTSGKLGIMPIPGAGANWFNYNSFPVPYVAPLNTSMTPAPALGMDTNGGFAAKGIITTSPSYTIKENDYSIIFQKDCTITLPSPGAWPGRILKLRAGTYTGTFNGTTVTNYGASITSFTKAIEIQSINGAWQLLSYSAQ